MSNENEVKVEAPSKEELAKREIAAMKKAMYDPYHPNNLAARLARELDKD